MGEHQDEAAPDAARQLRQLAEPRPLEVGDVAAAGPKGAQLASRHLRREARYGRPGAPTWDPGTQDPGVWTLGWSGSPGMLWESWDGLGSWEILGFVRP